MATFWHFMELKEVPPKIPTLGEEARQEEYEFQAITVSLSQTKGVGVTKRPSKANGLLVSPLEKCTCSSTEKTNLFLIPDIGF